jgi:hypothetical protein
MLASAQIGITQTMFSASGKSYNIHLLKSGNFSLKSLYCEAPFRRGGFADGVLIAEEANLIYRILHRHVLQPADGYEVFAALRVIQELGMVARALGCLQHRNITNGSRDFETRCWLRTACCPTNADETYVWNLHPHPITVVEHLERLGVPVDMAPMFASIRRRVVSVHGLAVLPLARESIRPASEAANLHPHLEVLSPSVC